MKRHNIALVILMALGISACGSSSGGNNGSSVAPPPPTTSSPTTSGDPAAPTPPTTSSDPAAPPTTSSDPAAPTTSDNPAGPVSPSPEKPVETAYTANAAIVAGGFIIPDGEVLEIRAKSDSIEDFNTMSVEGKYVTIIPQATVTNSIDINSANSIRLAYRGNHTLSGFVWDEGMKNKYLITQGMQATKDIPSGVITYRGKGASLYSAQGTKLLDTYTLNDVSISADFGSKQLTGTIAAPGDEKFKPVDIKANITGNTFYSFENGVKVQGGFFGDGAKEVTGDYTRTVEQVTIGVFNAVKQ